MTYIDRTYLEAVFGVDEIASLEAGGGGVASALGAANSVLDLAVGNGYVLPEAGLPAAVKYCLADMARYLLYKDPPKYVATRYAAAMDYMAGAVLKEQVAGRLLASYASSRTNDEVPW